MRWVATVREICARFPVPGLPDGVSLEELPFILVALAAAAAVACLLTPLAMRLATASGAMDEPDPGRRIHVRPIPRAGGLAVVAAFVGGRPRSLLFAGAVSSSSSRFAGVRVVEPRRAHRRLLAEPSLAAGLRLHR